MNEVLTKSFWQGVKRTFYEALEGPAPKQDALTPAEGNPNTSSTSEAPTSPTASNEQN